ncbi:hypothetical protein [Kluyvera genomosp. 1]|uniref:hypothetical protein n=1 Tax=Kluyvera genomosp. 1 TaxID=2774053 RepID=UPI000691C0E7|nr:hypothetical protein [Kluyvera genomosp. 1]
MSAALAIYGYNINNTIEYRLNTGILINIVNGKTNKLGDTNRRLLNFLISKSDALWVSDLEIIHCVFEEHGLRCSFPRLWNAMKRLKEIFESIDGSLEFIKRQDAKGYYLSYKSREILLIKDTSIKI